MEAATRVAKNTLILYLRMAVTFFMSLYSTRLLLSALGVTDFGLFNVIGGAIAMLTFLNGSMAAASQRFMSYYHGHGDQNKQKKIFNVSVLLHLFIGVTIILLLEVGGYILFNGVLKIDVDRIAAAKIIYQFLIVSTFLTTISVPYDAVLNAHENMFFVAILGVLEALLKLSIALFITYTTFDKLITYGVLMAALIVLLLVIKRIYCHIKYEEVTINIRKFYEKDLFKEMIGFAGWSFLGSTTGMIANYGQGIVLNSFFGTVVNAAQGVAGQVNGQLSAFSTSMLKALNPLFAKSEGAKNRSMLIKSIKLGAKVSFFLLSFFSIPVMIEMPFVLDLWLKEVPEYTVIFCRLLLLKSLQDQLFVTLGSGISAVGNIKKYQIYISILALLPLIVSGTLFYYGYPPYFMYIAFIVQVAIKSYFITLYHAKLNFDLSILNFLKDVVARSLLLFLFAASFGLIIQYYFETSVFRLLLVIVTCSIFSIFGLFFILFNTNEKKVILNVFALLIKKIGFK
jgi:O-antigen/teichoic acid export membrane protein